MNFISLNAGGLIEDILTLKYVVARRQADRTSRVSENVIYEVVNLGGDERSSQLGFVGVSGQVPRESDANLYPIVLNAIWSRVLGCNPAPWCR